MLSKKWLVLLLSFLLLGLPLDTMASTVQQGVGSPFQPSHLFLPWTSWFDVWTPPETIPQEEKTWTGIHLGSTFPAGAVPARPINPWPESMFDLIDPTDGDGIWPAVIVFKSDNVYEIVRQRDGEGCSVHSATRNGDYPSHVFEYIKSAALRGIPIIVRIHPSPGNFPDYASPAHEQTNHELNIDAPVGGDYCDFVGQSYAVPYRDPIDIAREIVAIQRYSKENGFEVFGFVPANEPNKEWYTNDAGWPQPDNASTVSAWEDMAAYFQKVYEETHRINEVNNLGLNIRVMTPPMSQNLYAEGINFFAECSPSEIVDSDGETTIGYEIMREYYENYNDGVTWHNYWLNSATETRTVYDICENGGGHVSYYFPDWLKMAIDPIAKPPFILEADIASIYQANPDREDPSTHINPEMLDKDDHTFMVNQSIRDFFQREYCYGGSRLITDERLIGYRANVHISSWLLSDNSNSDDSDTATEHHWHMVYKYVGNPDIDPSVYEVRPWFSEWWQSDENLFDCPNSIPSTTRNRQDVPLSTQMSYQNVNRGTVHLTVMFVSVLAVFTGLVSYNLMKRELLWTPYSKREREDE